MTPVTFLEALNLLPALFVGLLSVARITRLITQDTWPPVAALREWWFHRTMKVDLDGTQNEGPWYALVTCPYCAAPWVTLPVMLWGIFSDLHWTWWAFNGWLSAAYVAAIIVVKDGE